MPGTGILSEIAKFDKLEQAAYEQSLKYLQDLNNVINTARREGEQIGLEKGITRNENNQKEDFEMYATDDIFSEMIRKLGYKAGMAT